MTNLFAPQFNGKAHTKMQALAKPIGAICNIDCSYCYYLGKKELLNYSKSDAEVMSGERLNSISSSILRLRIPLRSYSLGTAENPRCWVSITSRKW
ncbi:putative arylsulfatase regulatory protein [Vibrio ishigakensis]|uniref:Putative arylsulfatase regulatory protein n=1 Tax=Vibrio ishigakensis TaxID=1481914 RepID=A0A0B8PNM8_9VIBR|nr:putative arylsulfatase regulatory protein [Vibrio ishigakensis]